MEPKRILILCPYPEDVAPGQRLKYEQYFDSWREAGYDLDIRPFVSRPFWDIIYKEGHFFDKVRWTIRGYIKRWKILPSIPKYDLVYVFLWVSPFGMPLLERLVAGQSKKLIYDIDDMVFLGHASKANKKWMTLKGKNKMIYLMKKAHHVITCTPYLDEYVRQHNDKTTDISSTINTDQYIPKSSGSFGETLTLGWSGSHSTSQYLHLLTPVFTALYDRGISFKLLVIGDPNFKLADERIELEALPWKRETEVRDLKRIDIGLYPLPDLPWVYGKSGLKALQYMSLGIPTIATNVGTIVRIIKHGENGFLATENEDWIEAISSLTDKKDLQHSMSKAAIKTVTSRFSVNANRQTYLDIIENVISTNA